MGYLLSLAACVLALSITLLAQPLRDLAAQRLIQIGAAVDPPYFVETAYTDTLAREFNQVEPENAMKFGPIQPGPTRYFFNDADAIVAFAQARNMAVRGHNLVWSIVPSSIPAARSTWSRAPCRSMYRCFPPFPPACSQWS
jgi:GH35 family endo-1,4-beta-xylanase